jgi:hypothetical protein
LIKSLLGAFAALGIAQGAAGATYFTTKCAQFNHPEFEINVSGKGVPRADIDWFLETLEGMVAGGEKFKPGETMQIGWMLTRLEQGERGSLRVTEPDMKSVPIVFQNTVDRTIRDLRSQKDSVESVLPATALSFPPLHQSVVVHVNYKQVQRIVLQRLSPSDSADSGWWLSDLTDARGAQDPKRFTKISLYQLAIDRPELVKFLAFPVGIQVVVDGRIGILKSGVELPIKRGSFLDLLNQRGEAR